MARTKENTRQGIVSLPVIALTTLSFALGCSEFIVVGILPDIAGSLAVDITLVGNLVGLFAGVYAIGTPVLAIATARVPKFRLLMSLCAVFAIGNVATALAPTYEVLMVARVLTASVSGAACTVSMTSPKLWGGMLVLMPTAMPSEPLIKRLGTRTGSTSGSFSVSS